jgi:hypothetical protein
MLFDEMLFDKLLFDEMSRPALIYVDAKAKGKTAAKNANSWGSSRKEKTLWGFTLEKNVPVLRSPSVDSSLGRGAYSCPNRSFVRLDFLSCQSSFGQTAAGEIYS